MSITNIHDHQIYYSVATLSHTQSPETYTMQRHCKAFLDQFKGFLSSLLQQSNSEILGWDKALSISLKINFECRESAKQKKLEHSSKKPQYDELHFAKL